MNDIVDALNAAMEVLAWNMIRIQEAKDILAAWKWSVRLNLIQFGIIIFLIILLIVIIKRGKRGPAQHQDLGSGPCS